MSKKNIAVLVSGGGTNLQSLIDAENSGMFSDSKITLVISSKPGVYALERAEKNGIATETLGRIEYENIGAYSHALVRARR